MDKRDLLIVFLSQFDISAGRMEKILENMEEASIKSFRKTKFDEKIIKEDAYQTMLASADETLVETYVKNLEDREIYITTIFNQNYPQNMQNINDAPYILYYSGDISLANQPSLSVVGSRKPTAYGKMVTERMVKDVASAGIVIVSGLAYGVDSIAHRVTLECGGKTIAVVAGGFDHIYPSEHQALAREIAKKGLLISEQRPKKLSEKYLFPLRNRIIAGISDGTLITEASLKSGTIHTKDFALDYGRNVYAVPGNIDSLNCELTNEVIKTGQAQCVTCGKDVLDDYDVSETLTKQTELSASKDEQKIINLLRNGMQNIDFLTKNCGLDINKFNTYLTMLEISGIISRLPGGNVVLN